MNGLLLSLWLVGAGSGVLGDDAYRFCHEPRYPLYEDERRWCELAGENNHQCPDLPAACKAGVEPGPFGRFSPGGEKGKRPAPPSGDDRKAARKNRSFSLPSFLSPVALFILIALLAVGLGLLIRHLLRNKIDDPEGDDAGGPRPVVNAPEETAAAIRAAKETDVQRLLGLAQAEATAGRFDAAMDLAYAAALRRLDGDGLIDLHHAKTNGDYVRDLRRGDAGLAQQLKGVVREVEGVQFGARPATRDRFEAVLSGVMGIVRRGATALMVLMLLSCGGDAGESDEAPQLGGDTTPDGTRAVLTYLAEEAPRTTYRIEPLETISDDVGTLVVLPGGGPSDDDWDPVVDWVRDGGKLILAGASADHPELEVVVDPREATDKQIFSNYFLGFQQLDGRTIHVPPSVGLLPQLGGEEAMTVLYRYFDADDPEDTEVSVYALGQYLGEGEVIVFATEDLFTNIAMAVQDNGRAIATMAAPRDEEKQVQVCTAWTGTGSTSPFDAVRSADLMPLIVQLLIFVALLMLYRGIAFGRLRDPERRGRRAFVDHVRAIGTHYARAGASGHAWRAYAAWALDQIDLRLPGQRRRGLDATAEAIAARTRWPVAEVTALLTAATEAAHRGGPPSMRGPASVRSGVSADGSASLAQLQRLATLLDAMGPSHHHGAAPQKKT